MLKVGLVETPKLTKDNLGSAAIKNGNYHVPPRRHSEEKQKEIRKQVDALLKLGIIRDSQAMEWCQVHLVPKPTPEGTSQKWRLTLDFGRLNSATGGQEG